MVLFFIVIVFIFAFLFSPFFSLFICYHMSFFFNCHLLPHHVFLTFVFVFIFFVLFWLKMPFVILLCFSHLFLCLAFMVGGWVSNGCPAPGHRGADYASSGGSCGVYATTLAWGAWCLLSVTSGICWVWMTITAAPDLIPSMCSFGKADSESLFVLCVWKFGLSSVIITTMSWVNSSALPLSLIHIWRCRRDVLCRSRWSPYH